MTVETYKGDAYCVKCKEKRDFEGTVKVSDSGRRMAQGICPVCGTKVNRILGKAQLLNFAQCIERLALREALSSIGVRGFFFVVGRYRECVINCYGE